MSLKAKIEEGLKEALKAHKDIRVSTYRLLLSALHNEEIAKQKDLSEDEELQVVRRQVKMREEAIEAYKKAKEVVRVEKEEEELSILNEFLPKGLAEQEIEKIVDEILVSSSKSRDFGFIMGEVMGKLRGRADGKFVAQLVQRKITNHKSQISNNN